MGPSTAPADHCSEMNIIPFRPEHLTQINVQAQQRRTISYLTTEYVQILAQGPAVTAVAEDRIIGCAGVVVQFMGMGTFWGGIAQDAGPHMLLMHRAARRLLEMPQLRRFEATSECDFPEGCRWLALLGFECEGRMKQ